MAESIWSILPPVITILLALWTKEVYMSLIIGIFSGAMLFTGGNFLQSTLTMFQVMADKVGSNVNILVFLVILALLVSGLSVFTALGETRRSTVTIDRSTYERLQRYEKLDEIMQYISQYYYKDIDSDEMFEGAINGMLASLGDPYTFYYNQEEWSDMWEEEEGEYTGIGIQLLGDYESQTVKITRVFRNTPAEAAGMRKNDILTRVEDMEVTAETMTAAVKIMRGEVGGTVEVEVSRDG